MTAGLVRKELRELRPFLLLGALLVLLDVGEWFLLQLDSQPLSVGFREIGLAVDALLFFLAFAVGTGLVVREIDDRTLGFLDGLPVTRRRVLMVKVAVAFAVLLLYPAAHMLMLVVQHLVARQSLDHALHAGLLWQSTALLCLMIGVGLALGLLLGFLRSLCWLTLGLCAFALAMLMRFWPGFAVLNPLELLDAQLVGVHWQLSTAGLATQLSLMCICILLAASIFLANSSDSGRKLQRWLSRPLVSAAVGVATIGISLGAVALFAVTTEDETTAAPVTGDGASAVQFAESPATSVRTQHYSFTYRAQQAEQAQAVLRDADRIHAEVAALLGATDGARIDVDLSGSMQNTEGTAFHDRIRMHLGKEPLQTLAHETAHVLAHRLAGGERERELSKMSVLNEGLATWVHNQVAGASGLTREERLQAAIVSRRHLVRPEQLTDMDTLARQNDINLRYPLGAALVDAMVTRYGRDAPGKLLRTLGDRDFPRDLAGAELWFAAFQASGFDLALVFDDYSRRLKEWETEFATQIAALPRPRGSLVKKDRQIGVELRFEGELPPDWLAVLRVRPAEDSPVDQYSTFTVNKGFTAWMPVTAALNNQLCFQPGVRTGDVTMLEAWVCLPIDSAAEQ